MKTKMIVFPMKKMGMYVLIGMLNLFSFAYAQEGIFILNEDKKVTFIIKNGYYTIDIDNSFDDVLTYDRLSFGKYERNGDTIQLKDILLNYTMEMVVINSRELVLTKGFHLWIGKTFEYDYNSPQWDWTKTIDNYETHAKNLCVHWRADTTFVCDTGWYVWKDFSRHGTDFQLKKDYRFEFTIGDMIFLSGRWNQVGNLLVFMDDIIVEPFYAIVDEDGIVPFLPNILGLWKYQHYYE